MAAILSGPQCVNCPDSTGVCGGISSGLCKSWNWDIKYGKGSREGPKLWTVWIWCVFMVIKLHESPLHINCPLCGKAANQMDLPHWGPVMCSFSHFFGVNLNILLQEHTAGPCSAKLTSDLPRWVNSSMVQVALKPSLSDQTGIPRKFSSLWSSGVILLFWKKLDHFGHNQDKWLFSATSLMNMSFSNPASKEHCGLTVLNGISW